MMRKFVVGSTLFLLAIASPASASVYTDDLTKCLVAKTSEADKKAVMRWMFALMSASPDVGAMASVTDAQRASFNREIGSLLQRLLMTDCRAQSKLAIKIDGTASIGTAFEYVGKVAMQELTQNAAVQDYLKKLGDTVDPKAWEAFMAEAGVPTGARKP